MAEQSVITVSSLSKAYKLYKEPIDRLREALSLQGRKYHKDFYAINNVSFDIGKGEVIGIIGKNGSGKSTLLKILTGVLTPTSGEVSVEGRITAMLELGAGFNPELSGLENIYFNGSLMGFSRKAMEEKLEEIIEFADIGEFIYQAVKTYSSGMKARLGFSVSINVDPDILIVDEVLSVGDVYFRQKSIRKMKEYMGGEKTILFVSHDLGAVKNFCTRAIWLNEGKVIASGRPEDIVKRYSSFMAYGMETKSNTAKTNSISLQAQEPSDRSGIIWKNVEKLDSFGEMAAKITHVSLLQYESSEPVTILQGGEQVAFYIRLNTSVKLFHPGIGLVLKDTLGNQIFGINNYVYDVDLCEIEAGAEIILSIKFKFPLIKNGDYVFTIAVSDGTQEDHIQHHWIHDGYALKIANAGKPFQRASLLILDSRDIAFEQAK